MLHRKLLVRMIALVLIALMLIANSIYIPMVSRSTGGTPVPTSTAIATATSTPTHTATPTQSTTPPPGTEGALFLTRTKRTNSASAAVDAAGGFHLAYAAYGPMVEGNEAYYAYCVANCETASNWGTTILIDRVEEVQLALTSAGHPRLLLRGPSPDGNTYFLKYAACDSNCTNIAGWAIADVTTFTEPPYWVTTDFQPHYFALDNLDRPRFIYAAGWDVFYAYCDSACTSASSWWKYPLNADIFGSDYPTLTFTSSGQPRITTTIMDGQGNSYLYYITCDTVCNNLASWTYTALMERGSGEINVSFVLKFTSSGQPRIVFNQGGITGRVEYQLYYLWCNTGCADGANWAGSSIGAEGQAEDPDLALDGLNHPRIAFRNTSSPDGLGYVWCDTNCESTSATWMGGVVEPSSDLDLEWDILPPLNCSGSYWWDGYRPSLVLDTAGNPRIGYVAQHLHGGGDLCWIEEDFRAVRFAFYNQP